MLDPDEVAAYEDWKARKLTGAQDLSIGAYNAEMEALALAYEQALKDALGSDFEKINSLKAANPYRRPGMLGHITRTTHTEGATA